MSIFSGGGLTSKVSQTDYICDQSSLVGLCMQDYKFLCVAGMICATEG